MNQVDELSNLLDDSIIVEYLEQNPDFFNRHPQLLTTLNIPTAQDGAVSLVARQQTIMRHKISSLGDEITSLMAMASQNQQLYLKFSTLFYQLLACQDISSLNDTLSSYLIEEINLDNVSLVLFGDNGPVELRHRRQTFENLIVQRCGRSTHYFGRINQQEQQLLFNQQQSGSVAIIGLGQHGELGLLSIASQDANHFQPEMDGLMLIQLCRLISSLIARLQ